MRNRAFRGRAGESANFQSGLIDQINAKGTKGKLWI